MNPNNKRMKAFFDALADVKHRMINRIQLLSSNVGRFGFSFREDTSELQQGIIWSNQWIDRGTDKTRLTNLSFMWYTSLLQPDRIPTASIYPTTGPETTIVSSLVSRRIYTFPILIFKSTFKIRFINIYQPDRGPHLFFLTIRTHETKSSMENLKFFIKELQTSIEDYRVSNEERRNSFTRVPTALISVLLSFLLLKYIEHFFFFF